jgi:hypothetical protein
MTWAPRKKIGAVGGTSGDVAAEKPLISRCVADLACFTDDDCV